MNKNEILIVIIVVLAGTNKIINWNYSTEGIKGIYTYMYLLPLCYFISKICFRKEIYRFIIYFVLIEIGFAAIEYILGISTLFKELGTYRRFDSYELLYYTRTFGLSGNSPIFAIKIFIALLLIDYLHLKKWTYFAIKLILLIGVALVFNRGVLLIIFSYFIFKLFQSIWNYFSKENINYISLILNLLFLVFWFHNPTWFKNQFSRNGTSIKQGRLGDYNIDKTNGVTLDLPEVEMSGRKEIWEAYLTFIKSNPIKGNGSKKYMIGTYHSHNSFLESASSNGLIIFILMLLLIAININRFNIIIIGFFLLLSLGQYFVFWGVSIGDIVFFSFLFHNQKDFECLPEIN